MKNLKDMKELSTWDVCGDPAAIHAKAACGRQVAAQIRNALRGQKEGLTKQELRAVVSVSDANLAYMLRQQMRKDQIIVDDGSYILTQKGKNAFRRKRKQRSLTDVPLEVRNDRNLLDELSSILISERKLEVRRKEILAVLTR